MKDELKILLIGNHSVSYCTEQDFAWTYRYLGHEVIEAQEDRTTTDEMWELGKDCDLVHYVHSHGSVTPGTFGIGELIQRFKDASILTIGYHLDIWYGLERSVDVGTHPWWSVDYTFTADGGSHEWYRSQGINHHYVKAGVVERDCKMLPSDGFKNDVIFVGSYHYHPEYPYRPQLIDWLINTYGERFTRIAGDMPSGTVRLDALNQLYSDSKIAIGDTLNHNFDHPNYFSDRLFESMGRGGFLIFPYIKGIEDCFVLGKELITYTYGDFDQLRYLIDYYLEHDDEREEIRLAGHNRVKKDHTYTNRVKEMFAILESEGVF